MIEPWIGSRWGQRGNYFNGKKLLILGEASHSTSYEIGSAPSQLLNDTVQTFVDHNPNWRFYRVLTSLLANQPPRLVLDELRRDIWSSVAFRNFVPVVAANYPRDQTRPEHFLLGGRPHQDFIQQYRPAMVLVCGKNLWGWLNQQCNHETDKPWSTPSPFEICGVPSGFIHHPSAAFSRNRWRPVLSNLLAISPPHTLQ